MCPISSSRSDVNSTDVSSALKPFSSGSKVIVPAYIPQVERKEQREGQRNQPFCGKTGLSGSRPYQKSAPNAAAFRMIMINANEYKPIRNPIQTCIMTILTSQIPRVSFGQIKTGYKTSSMQIKMPTKGKR